MLRKIGRMGSLFLIVGILCIAYYLAIIVYSGPRTSFAWFWLLSGVLLGLAAVVSGEPSLRAVFLGIPVWIRIAAGTLLALGIAVFLFAEGCIVSGMTARGEQPVDYLIVLGAQVRGTRVSRALKQRLDRALEYLKEHEETIVIVSGGQGEGEDISEAEAMERYLRDGGIAPERIRTEDGSVNTAQNIRYSRELIGDDAARIGIVSNDFHIFRAVHIAKAEGIAAEGIPAPSTSGMYPHYMMREAFAVVKDLVFGNLVF